MDSVVSSEFGSSEPVTNLDPSQRLMVLKTVPLWGEIESAEQLQHLAASVEPVRFSANQVIFHQGEIGHLLYILVTGRVQVQVGDLFLEELGPGSYFGEMALVDARPRSATAVALEASECWVLSETQFHQLLRRSPEVAIAMLQMLSRRIRHLNHLFSATEELFCLYPNP